MEVRAMSKTHNFYGPWPSLPAMLPTLRPGSDGESPDPRAALTSPAKVPGNRASSPSASRPIEVEGIRGQGRLAQALLEAEQGLKCVGEVEHAERLAMLRRL